MKQTLVWRSVPADCFIARWRHPVQRTTSCCTAHGMTAAEAFNQISYEPSGLAGCFLQTFPASQRNLKFRSFFKALLSLPR